MKDIKYFKQLINDVLSNSMNEAPGRLALPEQLQFLQSIKIPSSRYLYQIVSAISRYSAVNSFAEHLQQSTKTQHTARRKLINLIRRALPSLDNDVWANKPAMFEWAMTDRQLFPAASPCRACSNRKVCYLPSSIVRVIRWRLVPYRFLLILWPEMSSIGIGLVGLHTMWKLNAIKL